MLFPCIPIFLGFMLSMYECTLNLHLSDYSLFMIVQEFVVFVNILFSLVFALYYFILLRKRAAFPRAQLLAWLVAANAFCFVYLYSKNAAPQFIHPSPVRFLLDAAVLLAVLAVRFVVIRATDAIRNRITPRPVLLLVIIAGLIASFNISIFAMKSHERASEKTVIAVRNAPNVIFVLMDDLRYDRIHALGNPRNTTPNLDAIIQQSAVFTRAFTQATLTKYSLASIFTGLYPQQHKVNTFGASLPPDILTYPDVFKKHGYVTGAFSANPNVSPVFGFGQGIEYFYYVSKGQIISRTHCGRILTLLIFLFPSSRSFFASLSPVAYDNAQYVLGDAIKWISTKKDTPFFAYIHLMDVHSPYTAPDKYKLKYAGGNSMPLDEDRIIKQLEVEISKNKRISTSDPRARALLSVYDGQLSFMDEQIGEFIRELKRLGQYDNSVIVFCADHGEEFGEHGFLRHGSDVYNAQLHVPLFIHFPAGRFAGIIETPVPLFSSMATTVDFAGIALPAGREAKSLMPLIKKEKTNLYPGSIYSQMPYEGTLSESLIRWPLKLIRVGPMSPASPAPRFELFDISSDFDEKLDVSSNHADALKSMQRELDIISKLKTMHEAPQALIGEDTKNRLKQLGYVK